MARKYDLISELYNRTCKTVVSNPQNWQACRALFRKQKNLQSQKFRPIWAVCR